MSQSWSELLDIEEEAPPGENATARAPGLVGGRYQLINELGRGGMGHVYRVLDRLSGRIVTLKRLRRARPPSSGTLGTDSRILLTREFQLLASLRHPNIISVLDYGFDDEQEPYLVMDLEENARTIIDAGRDRPTAMQVELLVQALRALVYLHRHQIVHRDLKPENILVVAGQVRVLDFGLSASRAVIEAGGPELGGTPDYMAPELMDGAMPSARSDLYALGLVAYEMLIGRYPFRRDDALALRRAIIKTPLPRINDEVDRRLRPILGRLLQLEPEQRYADAGEVIRSLGAAVDQPFPVETVATRESLLQAAPFVGRAAELEQLTAILAQARSGRGGAWLIGGESGVGKSRLLDEIRTRGLVSGMIVVRGQGMNRSGGPYHVWRDILMRLILSVDLGDAEAAVLKDIVPQIDLLLGRRLPPPAPVEPEAALSRLCVAVEHVLRMQKSPVLIILEDMHWVGSESRGLWRWLLRPVEGLPIVLLGSFRDDEAADLPDEMPGHGVISLPRLTKPEIALLGEAMIGEVGRQPKLIEFLARETEGIPFFIVEVARALAEETGELSSIQEGRLPARVLSGGMQRLIRARLERVPAGTFRILQTAAIVGRDIDLDLMRTLYPGTDLDAWVTISTRAAVLELQDGTWRFGHDKLREQLLADLSPDTRRDLSRQVAEGLELTHPDRDQYVMALAHHWRIADDRAKEADYAELAGMQALQTGAGREAVEYLTRAAALLSTSVEGHDGSGATAAAPWRDMLRLDPNTNVDPDSLDFRIGVIEGGLAEVYHRLGEPEACLEHGRRALSRFAQYVPNSRSTWKLEVLRQLALRIGQGVRRAPGLGEERHRRIAGAIARVQERMTEGYYYAMLPMQLVWSSVRQVNQAWPAGPSRDLAQGYAMIGVLLSVTPAYRLAERWSRWAREIAEQTCSGRDLALILLRSAVVHMSSARWDEVRAALRRAFALADEVGDFRLLEENAVIETAMLIYTGGYERALERLGLALRLSRRAGDSQIERWSVLGHGDVYVRLNRNPEAIEQYGVALAGIQGAAMKIESIWGNGMLALARLRTGDMHGAFESASESLELMRSTQPVAYWMQHGIAASVEVFVTLAQMPEGLQVASRPELQLKARQACAGLRGFSRRFRLGRPPLYVWEGTRAWTRGRRRRALRLWRRGIALAEELQMPYEKARGHLEIGRNAGVTGTARLEHLHRAEEIFADLGCGYELELTRAQLAG